MKKSLLALAVLGVFAGAAQAQSSVTVYGSFDGGLRHTNSAAGSAWTVSSNGTYLSNRIGFKGVEDLGGGLNAHFTLETGFNTGNGALDNTTNQLAWAVPGAPSTSVVSTPSTSRQPAPTIRSTSSTSASPRWLDWAS